MRIALVALAGSDVVALLVPGLDAAVRLALHVAVTVAGYAVVARRTPIGIGGGMLGLFGPAGLLVATLARPRRALAAPADSVGGGAPPEPQATARLLDGRLRHAPAGTLGSLVTILRHGSVSARRRALETVVRSFEPALSPIIARALADRDQTIRALAAAAAARVSRNLAQSRATLTEDTARDRPGARDRLVALLADHARANVLLSDVQRDHLRRDALALLRDAPGDASEDRMVEETLAEAAWAAGDYDLIDTLAARGGGGTPALAWWRAA